MHPNSVCAALEAREPVLYAHNTLAPPNAILTHSLPPYPYSPTRLHLIHMHAGIQVVRAPRPEVLQEQVLSHLHPKGMDVFDRFRGPLNLKQALTVYDAYQFSHSVNQVNAGEAGAVRVKRLASAYERVLTRIYSPSGFDSKAGFLFDFSRTAEQILDDFEILEAADWR